MKTMRLTGIRQMQMHNVPDLIIENDTDVLIRMQTVGVCGSDVHYYVTGRIGSQVVAYPFTVGHEGAGIVEKVGKGVTRVKPGDRIAIEPAMSCWDCDQCLAGRHHTCRKLRFLGCPGQSPGCLSEYIIMPQESCFKVKDSMTMEQAAVSEPLAIGLYGAKESIPMQGARIGILGAGPIGLCVMLTTRFLGADRIYVTDKINCRIQLAKEFGADWSGNPDNQDIITNIAMLEPAGLDAVFECCGDQDALDQAIDLLKPGGKLMVIGIPQFDRVSFSVDKLRRKEICIQNVRRQCDCVQQSLDMIDNQDVQVDFMVTHRFDFDQSQEAFDLVSGYKDGVVKAMINFH